MSPGSRSALLLVLILLALAPYVFLGAFAIWQAREGQPFLATLIALPPVAALLAILIPGRGPGHFAFSSEIALGRADESDSKRLRMSASLNGPVMTRSLRAYEFRCARWWLVGASTLPLALTSIAFMGQFSLAAGLAFGVLAFSIAAALKACGALFRGFRATRRDD